MTTGTDLNLPGEFSGSVARLLGGADIGYYVGFVVAALWYAAGRSPVRTGTRP